MPTRAGGRLARSRHLPRARVDARRAPRGRRHDPGGGRRRRRARPTVAFAVVRPPGHHAAASAGAGFCLLNNVAIAAAALRAAGLARRVAIVDWDVHHGDGTQAIFDADPDLCYASTHQSPFYPGTGDRRGSRSRPRRRARSTTSRSPPGSGDERFVEAWTDDAPAGGRGVRAARRSSSRPATTRTAPTRWPSLEVTEAGYGAVAEAVGELARAARPARRGADPGRRLRPRRAARVGRGHGRAGCWPASAAARERLTRGYTRSRSRQGGDMARQRSDATADATAATPTRGEPRAPRAAPTTTCSSSAGCPAPARARRASCSRTSATPASTTCRPTLLDDFLALRRRAIRSATGTSALVLDIRAGDPAPAIERGRGGARRARASRARAHLPRGERREPGEPLQRDPPSPSAPATRSGVQASIAEERRRLGSDPRAGRRGRSTPAASPSASSRSGSSPRAARRRAPTSCASTSSRSASSTGSRSRPISSSTSASSPTRTGSPT